MSEKTLTKINAQSFLIVCFRFIGDVLMTTPLALSIKTAFPDADIDYLVFQGTDKAILKNPLIRNIITVPRQGSNLGVLLSLFRHYDVAVAAYPSDRSALAAAVTGKRSLCLSYRDNASFWKRLLLDSISICDDRNHVVHAMSLLASELGFTAIPRVSMGYDDDDVTFARDAIPAEHYILLHPYSLKRCKYWPAEHWGRLAALIHQHTNCTAVFTATPSADDDAYLGEIRSHAPPDVAIFRCSLNQFAAALTRCVGYVGIDTAATHIAAALEAPTTALYGPSLTRYWAPWPNGCREASPFAANRGSQSNGYVTVVQQAWECVPCNSEVCAISTRNKMECLEQLTPEDVFREVMDNVARYHQG
ncbi:MAG: glycosyltransferase family 9 protein [Desulfuromonadales bacterium]